MLNQIKKRHILIVGAVLLLVIAIAVIAFVANGSKIGEASSLSGTMMLNQEKSDGWIISANSINGKTTKNINFSSDNLAALHIDNTNSNGTVSLIISQGDIEKTVDINKNFSESIDMSDFKPGLISLRLHFTDVKDIILEIKW